MAVMTDNLASGLTQPVPAADALTVELPVALPVEQDRRAERSATRYPTIALKAAHSADRTAMQRAADALIRFASSTTFLAFHAIWFALWIAWNTGVLPLPVFDPFPFGLLTMVVSLEAIVLAIFVLIGQGRAATVAELREELTLQVNLRMEAEVTKTLQLVAGLYTRLGLKVAEDQELREMLGALDTERLQKDLMEQIRVS
jgi:uncharacterized membrane protein